MLGIIMLYLVVDCCVDLTSVDIFFFFIFFGDVVETGILHTHDQNLLYQRFNCNNGQPYFQTTIHLVTRCCLIPVVSPLFRKPPLQLSRLVPRVNNFNNTRHDMFLSSRNTSTGIRFSSQHILYVSTLIVATLLQIMRTLT